MKPEELQFCFSTGAFSCYDAPDQLTAPSPSVDRGLEASLWLTYLSGNHTGADVPVFAYGPGSQQLGGEIDNTDLFDVVTGALRLK